MWLSPRSDAVVAIQDRVNTGQERRKDMRRAVTEGPVMNGRRVKRSRYRLNEVENAASPGIVHYFTVLDIGMRIHGSL